MDRKLYSKIIWMIACAILLVFVLGACKTESSNAQEIQRRIIETFLITENSFSLQTNTEPIIEIFDGTTQYTIDSSGTLIFKQFGIGEQNMSLKSGDIVIERPASGMLTVVRDF